MATFAGSMCSSAALSRIQASAALASSNDISNGDSGPTA